jgi:hypothetical protein
MRSVLIAAAAVTPAGCGADDPGGEVGDVAGHPHARDGAQADRVGGEVVTDAEPVLDGREAEVGQNLAAGDEARHDRHRPTRDDAARGQPDACEAVLADLQRGDLAVDDADVAGGELFPLLGGRVGCGVQEQRHVAAPLAEQQGLVHGERPEPSTPIGWSRTSQPWE